MHFLQLYSLPIMLYSKLANSLSNNINTIFMVGFCIGTNRTYVHMTWLAVQWVILELLWSLLKFSNSSQLKSHNICSFYFMAWIFFLPDWIYAHVPKYCPNSCWIFYCLLNLFTSIPEFTPKLQICSSDRYFMSCG